MLRIWEFLVRNARTLLFIVLEVCALCLYANSTSLARARLLAASNAGINGINKMVAGVGEYFSLREENRKLTHKLTLLANTYGLSSVSAPDTLSAAAKLPSGDSDVITPYLFSEARVIRNTISKRDNFFVIDKGARDGIEPDMAVVTPTGEAVGYVMECTERFSICMSMLNSKFSLGGMLKDKDYFGFLEWNGDDYRHIKLNDIPVYADIAQGDTILSTISFRFPPDIMIGTVTDFKVAENITNYEVKLRLSADFSRLKRVLVVKYHDAEELKGVEDKIGELEQGAER